MPEAHSGSDEESTRHTLMAASAVPKSETSSIPAPHSGDGLGQKVAATGFNPAHFGLRVGADASAAASASFLVAPIICIIDRSIVEKAASGATLSSCLARAIRPALTRPHMFLVSRPFLLVVGLYFGTYFVANSVDTITSTVRDKPASTVSSGTAKFAATSAVNLTLCVYKDSCFAKLFGAKVASSSPAAKIPKISYALFAARDSMTIFASFNLPPLIAPQLVNLPPAIKSKFRHILSTEAGRANTAQFVTPAAMQIISTPIHLLGLDLYNRQGRLGFSERLGRVTRDWAISAFARMGRIIPAFGVGGVVNANMRKRLMTKLE